ncbi:hypothetical protein DYU11_06580 [Fibrisoma montanum]|uniref:Uncharacterized protein n=1 Tax=Fibrisoma montanum TaxID=2305895 RepID=A0A418MDT7_9BACT|nr:hypothetical protein DYU11_06580 [Fibrisoma montanum]
MEPEGRERFFPLTTNQPEKNPNHHVKYLLQPMSFYQRLRFTRSDNTVKVRTNRPATGSCYV